MCSVSYDYLLSYYFLNLYVPSFLFHPFPFFSSSRDGTDNAHISCAELVMRRTQNLFQLKCLGLFLSVFLKITMLSLIFFIYCTFTKFYWLHYFFLKSNKNRFLIK
ncbi:hypothetical protein EDEG_00420 [Edhazardia aedis USNM 41457]|uniref:Uncharacterized protein n=1 Tax=Edhazardia aedis (strain USNM 41457) TaxID=1003232 RepID=J8ZPG8_EDHAE|nr:hypothetical protein EDEG_00420 [Edhazardia aedis USNM 41457]|eukprot:EJW01568.1 hypothetical protein EDEG_00420 [Edhazardia aedis USNM 41457]